MLAADDCEELLDWLRYRPLAKYSRKLNTLLVHAGVPPQWSVEDTLSLAREVEARLQSDDYEAFLSDMYGNSPNRWRAGLSGNKRLRVIVNSLTRMRMVHPDGRLDFSHTGPPGNASRGLIPWFDAKDARWRGTRIVFGHWSALGLLVQPELIAVDTGCVWGRQLTAVRLNKKPKVVKVGCSD